MSTMTKAQAFNAMKGKVLSYIESNLSDVEHLYTLISDVLSRYSETQMIMHLKESVQDQSNIPRFIEAIEKQLSEHQVKVDDIPPIYRTGLHDRLGRLCRIALLV